MEIMYPHGLSEPKSGAYTLYPMLKGEMKEGHTPLNSQWHNHKDAV